MGEHHAAEQEGVFALWEQFWIVESPEQEAAEAFCRDVLERWSPKTAGEVLVGPSRFYSGRDDPALGEQYWQEFSDIQAVVKETPREDWRRRFAELGQRGLGIPPHEGFVVVEDDFPRSPRPKDWSKPHGPRWIVTVHWPGDPPVS